jgi:hypothetical protein
MRRPRRCLHHGSWDANDPSKITTSGGNVVSISGSDSTTNTLTASGTLALASRVDGNGNTKSALSFSGTQALAIASGLGITSDLTIIAIVEWKVNNVTQAVAECGVSGGVFATNRHVMLCSSNTSSGVSHRKIDASSNASIAQTGAAPSAGAGVLHCYIGRSPSGSSQAILDAGNATNLVGAAATAPAAVVGLNSTSWGCTTESSAQTKFGQFYGYRLIFVKGAVADADVPNILSWGSTNYGTVTS